MGISRQILQWLRALLSRVGVAVVSTGRLRQLQMDSDLLRAQALHPRRAADCADSGVADTGAAGEVPGSGTRRHAIGGQDVPYWPPHYPFPHLAGGDDFAKTVRVVDVGAEALEFEEDIYAPLLVEGQCEVIGFDPFVADARREEIRDPRGEVRGHRLVLPYFIGDGGAATFHVNAYGPTSSLLPTNVALARQFTSLAEVCETKRKVAVKTVRLDDVAEVSGCDFLKIDVQGGDFDVIAHAPMLLADTLFVHIETEFAPLYAGQKLFADIDKLLRDHGFELVDLVKLGWNNYKEMPSALLRSRLLWADAIYLRETGSLMSRDPRLLLRAAFIAHANYRKYDLAAHLLATYDSGTGSAVLDSYLEHFARAATDPPGG